MENETRSKKEDEMDDECEEAQGRDNTCDATHENNDKYHFGLLVDKIYNTLMKFSNWTLTYISREQHHDPLFFQKNNRGQKSDMYILWVKAQ